MDEELEALLDELGLDEFEIEQEIENYNQQNNN